LKQGMTTGAGKIRDHLRGLASVPVLLKKKANALGWNPL
jgi:hypothetical protein